MGKMPINLHKELPNFLVHLAREKKETSKNTEVKGRRATRPVSISASFSWGLAECQKPAPLNAGLQNRMIFAICPHF